MEKGIASLFLMLLTLIFGVFAYFNPVVARPNFNLHRMRVVCAEVLILEIKTLIT